jgi:RNA polymerase sigma factor (sigma-70 family)
VNGAVPKLNGSLPGCGVEDPERKGFVPDRAIVEGIRAGQEDAQRLLWDKYWPWLVVTARHTGLSEQDAEEVVSDVFFRMLQRIEAGRTGDNLGPLLRAATRNASVSHYRQSRDRREHETETPDVEAHVVNSGDGSELQDVVSYRSLIVRRALETLSPGDQEVLSWIGHDGTNEELAEWTGTNLNNARQLRLRALRRLKQGISTIIQGLPEEKRRQALEKMFDAET